MSPWFIFLLAVAVGQKTCLDQAQDQDPEYHLEQLTFFVSEPANIYVLANAIDLDGRPALDLDGERITVKEDGVFVPSDAVYELIPPMAWKTTMVAFLISHSYNTEAHMMHVRESIDAWMDGWNPNDGNLISTVAMVTAHTHALVTAVPWTSNKTQVHEQLWAFQVESTDHSVNLNGAIIDMIHDMQNIKHQVNGSMLTRQVIVLITDSGKFAFSQSTRVVHR
jgi:hypothetical protein